MPKVLIASVFFLGALCVSAQEMPTPYELSGKKRTATYDECVAWYQSLNKKFPKYSSFESIGLSDGGNPIYVFRIFGDNPSNKLKLLINNNIHPGEPEGTDASMLFCRDLLFNTKRQNELQSIDIHVICQYNTDGSRNQSCCTRANQNGPENQGFRGNARNLDLNRDFIKSDSRNARAFATYFSKHKFDFFIDNHTSNGADYQYVLTYFHTRPEKLSAPLNSTILRLDSALKKDLLSRGWPTAPYVETMKTVPDSGIHAFWETGRYATGYAALHHCMGFTVETHMLKPFNQRVDATLAFLNSFTQSVIPLKAEAVDFAKRVKVAGNRKAAQKAHFEMLNFQLDTRQFDTISFLGYEYGYKKSEVTGLPRLYYNRSRPWTKPIKYYRYFKPTDSALIPRYYVIPFAWSEVRERLSLNSIEYKLVSTDTLTSMRVSYIDDFETVKSPYEGHYLHYNIKTRDTIMPLMIRRGDCLVPVNQANVKFLAAVLEGFSDYVWADKAEEILKNDADLRLRFEKKREEDKKFANDAWAQWDWIYKHSDYYEKTHRLYPIGRID
jgi:hypothetical protein